MFLYEKRIRIRLFFSMILGKASSIKLRHLWYKLPELNLKKFPNNQLSTLALLLRKSFLFRSQSLIMLAEMQ